MAQLATAFDPAAHDPLGSFDPIPEDDYDIMLLGSSVEQNSPQAKDPNGNFLKLEWEVTGGPHSGRKLFDNITLRNTNVQAIEIGQRKLSALCHSMGWMKPLTDSDVLHGRTCRAHVKVRPAPTDEATGKPRINPKTGRALTDQNEIGHYIVPNNGAAPAQASVATAAPANGAAKKKPWEK